MIRLQRHELGPRVWICGVRIHHGATGCLLALAGMLTNQRRAVLAGLALCAHDRADYREWF